MKLQPFYRSPFDAPGMFSRVSRKEAATLLRQWRNNGRGVNRLLCPIPGARRYKCWGNEGEDASMVLRPNDSN